MSVTRNPAQAGRFYPSDPEKLKKDVEQYIVKDAKKEAALGIVAPHAGFMYSGKAAGAVYSRVKLPDVFIILGPNHSGMGTDTAIMTEGYWSMPNGNVRINSKLARSILSNAKNLIKDDENAHAYEHSLETQLPFIQYFRKKFSIVPICMRDYSAKTCRAIGKAIADSLDSSVKALIIASSDMSHYESVETAKEKDNLAIDKIVELDPEGLLDTVSVNNISMCGSGPAAVMLFAAKSLGAKKAELVFYNTSGDSSGDYSSVVGYAGILVK